MKVAQGWLLLTVVCITAIELWHTTSNVVPVRAKSISAPRGQDARNIVMLRQAGLRADRTQIPKLLAALNDPPHPYHRYTAIHSLAQMGAVEALPAFDGYIRKSIMQTNVDSELSDFTRVARARLLAESNSETLAGTNRRSQARMRIFINELGLRINQLNNTRAEYDRNQRGAKPLTLFALRELADMIYQKHDIALARYAQDAGISFDQDLPSTVKVGLASLTQQDRLNWLIEKLSNMGTLTPDNYYIIQLAVNEGEPASRAAAATLEGMKRGRYKGAVRFGALMYVIAGVDDQKQGPVVAQFLNDPDKSVAHYAENTYYRHLQPDSPDTFCVGY